LNRPHQANRPKTLSSSRTMVLRRRPEEKIVENGAFSSDWVRCCFHNSDSGTLVLIQMVTSAGSNPTKNTYRQFRCRRSSTIHAGSAAAASPQAQEPCTRARARARKCVGHVSATSVAPVFHSPPMPSPSTKRKKISTPRDVESPEPSEHREYVRMLN